MKTGENENIPIFNIEKEAFNDLKGDVEGIERRSLGNKDLVDFAIGTPPYELFPLKSLQESCNNFLSNGELPTYLQYGAGQGSEKLRKELSNFINSELNKGCIYEKNNPPICKPSNIFITNGSSHGLDLICKLFTSNSDYILVEESTYFFTFDIFKNYKLKIIPVKINQTEGVNLDDLKEKLYKYKPGFIYIIPTYHNPVGCTISYENREKLVEIIYEYNEQNEKKSYLVCDEVYQFLYFNIDKLPPSPIWYFDKKNKYIISLNSFSKIIAPGLRLGWIYSNNDKIIERIETDGVVISGGGYNPFVGQMVYMIIKNGFLEKHLEFLRKEIGKRAETLYKSLINNFPNLNIIKPEGGYFLWIDMKKDWDHEELKKKALQKNTFFKIGSDCCVKDKEILEKYKNYVRICFSHYREERLKIGADRLKEVF